MTCTIRCTCPLAGAADALALAGPAAEHTAAENTGEFNTGYDVYAVCKQYIVALEVAESCAATRSMSHKKLS